MKDLVNCGMLGLAMIGCTMLIINKLNTIDGRLYNAFKHDGNWDYCTDKELRDRVKHLEELHKKD